MDLWLPGYEHDPEPGAGHNPTPGRRKVIIHTTETGPGTLAAVRNSWRGPANWAKGLPHFIAEGDRYVQLLPLNTGAYTSKGGPDSANKTGCPIQIEIVGKAANAFNDVEYGALGRWLADLVKAGVELDLSQHPRFYGDREGVVLATESSPVRGQITTLWGSFANFAGFCGHQHLRGNDHWDPGFLDAARVERIARAHLASPTNLPEDIMSKGVKLPQTGNAVWVTTTDGAGRLRRQELTYPNGTSAAIESGLIDEVVELNGQAAEGYWVEWVPAAPITAEWGNATLAVQIKDAVKAATTELLAAIEADDDVVTPQLPPTFAADLSAALLAKVEPAVTNAAKAGAQAGVDAELDAAGHALHD